MEYHRVLQNGYHPGAAIDAVQFVMQVMDENIAIGRFVERDVMLHQWQLYTKALSGLEFHYLRSNVVSTTEQSIVTSYASYKHVVTRDTLEVMFPEAMRRYPRITTVARCLGACSMAKDTSTSTLTPRRTAWCRLTLSSTSSRSLRICCRIRASSVPFSKELAFRRNAGLPRRA
ncbi:hypothetical protein PR003_g12515 [Phytophthora rubi]|uniref:Uncharacterized protein n=1 Tax=Phytophthora rubi TaxID=129364 RepID=A0A6A4F7Z7_9STRA|nr:hypothetical protein PR003_g12515 [Phytophthora rubi]